MIVVRYFGIYIGCLCVSPSVISPLSVSLTIFLFLSDNLSKYQRIFTKLGIDIVEIGFGIANSKFHQFLTELFACHTIMVSIITSHFYFLYFVSPWTQMHSYR